MASAAKQKKQDTTPAPEAVADATKKQEETSAPAPAVADSSKPADASNDKAPLLKQGEEETSAPAPAPAPAPVPLKEGKLDLRRRAAVARAGPWDHAGEVIQVPNKDFDLNKTIFRTIDSALARKAQRDRLAVSLYWNEEAASQIHELYSALPKAIPHDKGLLDFMANECNFSMEHADGSFMDHLQFCYEYSLQNMAQYSPRVMLLHSILGVGTNIFPMEVSKLPTLKTFLTEFELEHITAFPAVLRLLVHNPLLSELEAASTEKLTEKLEGIRYHSVIDNEEHYMDAESFWVHLNYHLIHFLDFLPAADWELLKNDNHMQYMGSLHALLTRCGKLFAKVDLTLTPLVEAEAPFNGSSSSKGTTLGGLLMRWAPRLQKRLMSKTMARWSGQIGHSLEYELKWKQEEPSPDANGDATSPEANADVPATDEAAPADKADKSGAPAQSPVDSKTTADAKAEDDAGIGATKSD